MRFLFKNINCCTNVTFKKYFDHLCWPNFSSNLMKINDTVKTILFFKLLNTVHLAHLVSVLPMFDLVTANCL